MQMSEWEHKMTQRRSAPLRTLLVSVMNRLFFGRHCHKLKIDFYFNANMEFHLLLWAAPAPAKCVLAVAGWQRESNVLYCTVELFWTYPTSFIAHLYTHKSERTANAVGQVARTNVALTHLRRALITKVVLFEMYYMCFYIDFSLTYSITRKNIFFKRT